MDREDTRNGGKLYGQPNQIFHYGLTIPDLCGFSFSLWGTQYQDFKFGQGESHPSEDASIWNTRIIYHWHVTDRILIEPFASVENLSDETYYGLVSYETGIMEGRAWHLGVNLKMDF